MRVSRARTVDASNVLSRIMLGVSGVGVVVICVKLAVREPPLPTLNVTGFVGPEARPVQPVNLWPIEAFAVQVRDELWANWLVWPLL